MDCTQFGESLTGESEVADVLCLIWLGGRRRSEALLGKIGPPVKTDQLFRVGLDVIKNLSEQLVRQRLDASRCRHAGSSGVSGLIDWVRASQSDRS